MIILCLYNCWCEIFKLSLLVYKAPADTRVAPVQPNIRCSAWNTFSILPKLSCSSDNVPILRTIAGLENQRVPNMRPLKDCDLFTFFALLNCWLPVCWWISRGAMSQLFAECWQTKSQLFTLRREAKGVEFSHRFQALHRSRGTTGHAHVRVPIREPSRPHSIETNNRAWRVHGLFGIMNADGITVYANTLTFEPIAGESSDDVMSFVQWHGSTYSRGEPQWVLAGYNETRARIGRLWGNFILE